MNSRQHIDGVLLLDKPTGWTSNAALQKTKWLFNAAKAGHTGTLDPFASGLLPICFGQATKFSSYALHGDKNYHATLKLGVTTSTGDLEGETLDTRNVHVTREDVLALLPRFTGAQQQTPPMYSALKHEGKPLYEYARADIEIERKPRAITIHALEMVGMDGDVLTLDVHCSGGTYIRTLAEDLGQALGCGAHLIGLRRTASGAFSVADTVSLAELEAMSPEQRNACLLPPDSLLGALPAMRIEAGDALLLAQGKHLPVPAGQNPGQFRAYSPRGFLGVINVDGEITAQRLMDTASLVAVGLPPA